MNPRKSRCFQSRNGSRWSKHRLDMDINERQKRTCQNWSGPAVWRMRSASERRSLRICFFRGYRSKQFPKQSLHAMATKKTANKCDILLTCVVMQDRHTHVAKRLLCGYEDKIVVEATSKKWFLKMARATAIGWHSPQSMAPPALQVPRSQPVKSCAIGHRANGGRSWSPPVFFSNLREIVFFFKKCHCISRVFRYSEQHIKATCRNFARIFVTYDYTYIRAWNPKQPVFNGCFVEQWNTNYWCNDLESSNWNNYFKVEVSSTRNIYIYVRTYDYILYIFYEFMLF